MFSFDLSRRAFCLAAGGLGVALLAAGGSRWSVAGDPISEVSKRKAEFLRFWGITVTPNDAIGTKANPAVRGMGANSWNNLFYIIPQLEMATREPGSVTQFSGVSNYIWPRTLQFINDLRDCSDFVINAALRMLHLYPKSDLLGDERREQLKQAVLNFVYWYDEPTQHNGVMLTENHQILFSTAELLAGELYPDEIFPRVQKPGQWRAARAKERVLKWLDWRTRFGFSEWLSSHYYDEDLVALFNLQQFATDAEIRQRAEDVLNIVLLEMAMHSHGPAFNGSQGRVYSLAICRPKLSLTSPITAIAYGKGYTQNRLSMSAVCFATSPYEPPAVLQAIAHDSPAELEIRQRSSVAFEDLARFGLDPKDPSLYPMLESTGLSSHPEVLPAAAAYLPAESRYGKEAAIRLRHRQKNPAADAWTPYTLTAVNVCTFRTPQFMLSCAQDWNKGRPGYQQHIWTAVLDDEAQVFTTQPHKSKNRVDRWAGNGCLPRAVMHRNVLICMYRVPETDLYLPETHAWFPKFAFDDVREQGGWVFGRKGDAYVALRSQQPAEWIEPDEKFFERYWYRGQTPAPMSNAAGPVEYLAKGATNVWICELGNPTLYNSFDHFIQRIAAARVEGNVAQLRYDSPSIGEVHTGWDQPLTVTGRPIELHSDNRFDAPYCKAKLGDRSIIATVEGGSLLIGDAKSSAASG